MSFQRMTVFRFICFICVTATFLHYVSLSRVRWQPCWWQKQETFDQKVGQFTAVCYQVLRNVTYKIQSCKIKKG